MHACKPLSVSSTYQSGSSIGTLVLLFDVFILNLLDIFVLFPSRFLWLSDCYFRSWLRWCSYPLTCKYYLINFVFVIVVFAVGCCVFLSAFVVLYCVMLCVCISVWFCYYLFLHCMHVYCKYVCYLFSIYHSIKETLAYLSLSMLYVGMLYIFMFFCYCMSTLCMHTICKHIFVTLCLALLFV